MQPQVIICKDRAEWLEARKDGLGASDAAALLGLSPWKTNVQLWEEKCGLVIPEDIGDKPYVRYGNDAEPLLRSFFALDHPEYRVSFTPYKIIKHQDLPFITCTPDGELEETATGRLGGLEIKTTEILSSTGWTHWKGRIPTEYYAQVCQQMLAAGWQFVELLAQIKYTTAEGEDRKETRHYKIERADAEDDIACAHAQHLLEHLARGRRADEADVVEEVAEVEIEVGGQRSGRAHADDIDVLGLQDGLYTGGHLPPVERFGGEADGVDIALQHAGHDVLIAEAVVRGLNALHRGEARAHHFL